MVNKAPDEMGNLFPEMYENYIKGWRPSITPEKLLRAMLLQVLYTILSERQLMEQTQYNLLFRWFIGLSLDDAVWVPTVFTKNRERLIEHDAVVAFFNAVLKQADKKRWLSKEHFSVDGTLIQAWAGHKSFVRKDGKDDDDGGDFRGKTANELRFMDHTLMENRNGLIVNATVTQADGHAERQAAKAMVADVRQAGEISQGADKGNDAAEFITALQYMKVTPHVAQNKANRKSAVPDEIAATKVYGISMQKRKVIEQGVGWAKFIGPIRQMMVRGFNKVDQVFMLAIAAYNVVRMRTLGANPSGGRVIRDKHPKMASDQAQTGLKWGGLAPKSARIIEQKALASAAKPHPLGICWQIRPDQETDCQG